MKKIIEFSDVNIDAILAGNDGMIDGIYETLKEYNLNKKILLAGLDAEPQALKRILNSDQTITIYTSLKKLAYAAAILSADLLKNKKTDNENFTKVYNNKVFVPSLILSPEIVDKNNIETTVIADGFISIKEIENTNY
jgi:ABC-type xylose transport system substrate-binding protein